MGEKFKWLPYGGKYILYFDYQKLKIPEFIEALHESLVFMKKQNKTDMLFLFDIRGTLIFGDGLKEAREFAKAIKPYRKKTAFLGVEGPKKILLNSILRMTGSGPIVRTFDSIDDAKVWLVS